MKMPKISRILFTLMVLMTLAGCNLPVQATPQPAPVTPSALPTETIPPTATPQPPTPTAPVPTDTPIPTQSPDFTEEFSGGLEGWSYFLTRGSDASAVITVANDALSVALVEPNIWVYITFDKNIYQNVEISTVAENRGENVNNISLVCGYSEMGWYEFNISSAGVYNILAYDSPGAKGTQGYNLLKEGASTLIKTGFAVNTITATCDGNQLAFSINGEEVAALTDETFLFYEGKVGVGVKSLEQRPVAILFDSFTTATR